MTMVATTIDFLSNERLRTHMTLAKGTLQLYVFKKDASCCEKVNERCRQHCVCINSRRVTFMLTWLEAVTESWSQIALRVSPRVQRAETHILLAALGGHSSDTSRTFER